MGYLVPMNLAQPSHLLLVLLVFIVLFGAKRLPDSARSLGQSLRIFKSEMNNYGYENKNDDDSSTK
jgi:TatA/E family protein of Tat protein translocase